jgi:excisionase family DNA binding protein
MTRFACARFHAPMSYEVGLVTGTYLTTEEFARRLRVTRSAVYRAVARGDVRAVQMGHGGTLRIPAAELRRLLQERDPAAALKGEDE